MSMNPDLLEFLLILAFLAGIILLGRTAIRRGGFMRLLPGNESKTSPPGTGPGSRRPGIEVSVMDDGVAVLKVSGILTMPETIKLRDAISEQLAHGRTRLVLDLSDLSYLDSSGIGEIISGFTRVLQPGGKICIVIRGRLRSLFEILAMGILRTCLHDSIDEALGALRCSHGNGPA